jgi:hypothetical protein
MRPKLEATMPNEPIDIPTMEAFKALSVEYARGRMEDAELRKRLEILREEMWQRHKARGRAGI